MFGKILGKDKEANVDKYHQIIIEKVSKMNLVEMKVYVNNSLKDFGICEDGLSEVMKKLNSKDSKTSKRFIEMDAMDSKKKKAFDLVIIIANSKKVTIVIVELIQEFMETYKDLILKYDTDNKEIYGEKIKNALKASINTISSMAEMNRKSKLIGS